MDTTDEKPIAQEPDATKLPWERPMLARLGDVKDLVQGGGKSGPNADSDPNQTKKLGVG